MLVTGAVSMKIQGLAEATFGHLVQGVMAFVSLAIIKSDGNGSRNYQREGNHQNKKRCNRPRHFLHLT